MGGLIEMVTFLDRINRINIILIFHFQFPPARHRPPEADSGEAGVG